MAPKAATIATGAATSATVVQLKAFLTERGLAVDGLKAELVERVEAALAVRFCCCCVARRRGGGRATAVPVGK